MEAFVTKTGGQEQLLQNISDAMENIQRDKSVTMQNLAPEVQAAGQLGNTFDDLKTSIQVVLRTIEDDMRLHAEFRGAQGSLRHLLR